MRQQHHHATKTRSVYLATFFAKVSGFFINVRNVHLLKNSYFVSNLIQLYKPSKNPRGYIAFLAVIILGTIGGLIAVTLYLSGIQNSQSSLLNIQEKEARYLADSCSEIAIQQIINITENNSTSSTFNISRGSCSFTITDTVEGYKQINSVGTVDGVTRKNTVIINPDETTTQNTVKIIYWQENP